MQSASPSLQHLLHKMEPSKLLRRGFSSVHLQQTALSTFRRALFMLLICFLDFPLTECLRPFAETGAVPGVAPAVNGTAFKKIFIFGDSYVDNGNLDPKINTKTVVGPVNKPWKAPYGQSNPESPTGRFSDGNKVLSDFLAAYIGLNPTPYNLHDRPSTLTEDGTNFGTGGAGVFDSLGFSKTRDQIAQLKAVLRAEVYSASVYNESLILFTISGNDYHAFLLNAPPTGLFGIGAFVVSVVHQMAQDLRSLYDLGFRNFAVSYLPPVGCLPAVTIFTEYTSCVEIINALSTTHNNLLNQRLSTPSTLPGANVIFLNTQLAFTAVIDDPLQTDFPKPLTPCCSGIGILNLCGDLDNAGRLRYTVCSVTSTPSFFFWDQVHLTQAGWKYIFNNLFLQGTPDLYTNGKSLAIFLHGS